MIKNLEKYYKNKKVLITGHTGFKGTWMSLFLSVLGAKVYGYALEPDDNNAIYSIVSLDDEVHSEIGDIRDKEHLKKCFDTVKPEYVFHFAAQPLVRQSYIRPVETYETNVMGTVNVCENIRNCTATRSFLNVTTDKVYLDNSGKRGYVETDALDGYEPYSNSKSCSELVTHSYYRAFLQENGVAVSTARAGNVIGGGDFAKDRIIPDCVRATMRGKPIFVRNPHMIRPFQHVLDPLYAYLLIAAEQHEEDSFSSAYNVGPEEIDCVTVERLVTLFCDTWGDEATWITDKSVGPHESDYLKLDCSLMKRVFDWRPIWGIEQSIAKTVEWYWEYNNDPNGKKLKELMCSQIEEVLKSAK